jgi:hypothetical protein
MAAEPSAMRAILGALALCCGAMLCIAAATNSTTHAVIPANAENSANAANAAYVQTLFEEAFHHPPPPNQLASFTTALNNGTSRVAVAKTIVASPEFRSNIVGQYYLKYLGRQTTTGSVRLADSSIPLAQVANSILSSPEYYARKGGTAAGFVAGLYSDLLGRPPDSSSEVLVAFEHGDESRPYFVGKVWNSPEAARFRINDYFLTYAGRAGTSAQTALLASRLAAGGSEEDALADILASAPPGKKP